MVGQDPVLFSGSIRDNIAYGLTDCDQKKVEDAAKDANAHDFISRLEKRYDTGTAKESFFHLCMLINALQLLFDSMEIIFSNVEYLT